ncbi:MAG TPA: AsmA family protein, partial [Burkholderiaceae bacterium]
MLGALGALLAIGYVALTRAFPLQRLAAMLADEVQTATGREFRIAGGLSFQLLPTIAVVAQDMSVGNAPWG